MDPLYKVSVPPKAAPSFTVKDLRAAIPAHCFERSVLTSSLYVLGDLLYIGAIFYAATYIQYLPQQLQAAAWVVYWIVQGSFMTGLWVLGHECGHQAFSPWEFVNDSVGIIIHTLLLVPYHAWKITHGKHHGNTNDMDNDEVFVPAEAHEVSSHEVPSVVKSAVQIVIMFTLGWPGYLLFNVAGPAKFRGESHFNPFSKLFSDRQRFAVFITDVVFGVVCYGLYRAVQTWGASAVLAYYGIPYLVNNFWLVLITYLQHTDVNVPHFAGKDWNWLRGALCTVDRDFGILNIIFHHISDTHVCHHLFSKIPHYHAQEATAALRPVLGKYHLKDDTPIAVALWRAFRNCLYVDRADGEHLFYHSGVSGLKQD